uniref:Uncharacterized protein n=1 Tax=Lepeophtheirus salmonis TaxID=72036 RepID=A0A0K2UB79_LEPSM
MVIMVLPHKEFKCFSTKALRASRIDILIRKSLVLDGRISRVNLDVGIMETTLFSTRMECWVSIKDCVPFAVCASVPSC